MLRTTPLGDYLELVTYGFTNPMPDSEEGPWKVTAKDVLDGRINYQTARKTTQLAFDEELTDKSRPKTGDVLLTKDGTLGRLAVVREEGFCVNQSVAVLRPNSKINPDFLYYLLASPKYQHKLLADSDGSVLKHIYITRVPKMEVEVPQLSIQEKIVNILGTLDDKIELNRQMNATLESMAQALFKSWFVDFDPVIDNALASGNPIPEPLQARAETRAALGDKRKPLPAEIQQLFPDRFTFTDEMGWVPEGWTIKRLGDSTSKFATGLNPRKNFVLGEGSNYYVTIKNMRDNDVVLDDKCDKVTGDALSKINARADLQVGDSLFSGIGTIGRVFYVDRDPSNWNTSESVFSVRADASVMPPVFLYRLLLSNDLQSYAQQLASGSVQKGIRMSALKDYQFVLPDKVILGHAERVLADWLRKWKSNNSENKYLASVRDTLLPKLLSGQLRIPEAEQQVAEAL